MRRFVLVAIAIAALIGCGGTTSDGGAVPGEGPCRTEDGSEWYFYADSGKPHGALFADRAVQYRYDTSGRKVAIAASQCPHSVATRHAARTRWRECIDSAPTQRSTFSYANADTLSGGTRRTAEASYDVGYTYRKRYLRRQTLTGDNGSLVYGYSQDGRALHANGRTRDATGFDVALTDEAVFRVSTCLAIFQARIGSVGHCARLSTTRGGPSAAQYDDGSRETYTYTDSGRLRSIDAPSRTATFSHTCHD